MGNPGELSWATRGSTLERSDPGDNVGGEENSAAGWNRLHAGSDPRYTRRIAGAAWAGTISGAATVPGEKWPSALVEVHDQASA